MTRYFFALTFIFFVGSLVAQTTRDDLTPLEIAYELTVESDLRSLAVGLTIDNVARDSLRVAMPRWSPGAYRFHDAGKDVTELAAVDAKDGGALAATQIDHSTWSIDTHGRRSVRIRYRLPADKRVRRFTPAWPEGKTPIGIHYMAPLVFLYVDGCTSLPVTCRYSLPEGWQLANGLLPTADPAVRRARDYDTFIDAPTIVGAFQTREFEVEGTPFSCVYWDVTGAYDFDLDAATDVCRRIVTEQGRTLGSFPFFKYWFLFTVSPRGGGGGLEHLNSTSIGLSTRALKSNPASLAGIVAHEFFHTWNVKRIRPKSLGPFAYDRENYTGNLWVSEGWTSYYGDLSILRSGLMTRDRYLASMGGTIARESSKERRLEHSVTWASRNVWHRLTDEDKLGPRVDYYGKGEMLGFLIDLEMRAKTDGRKSLDDVMRFLNRWFAEHGEGFAEDDVERACTAVSNHDFSEFFARHVDGTLDAPFDEILAPFGLELERSGRRWTIKEAANPTDTQRRLLDSWSAGN